MKKRKYEKIESPKESNLAAKTVYLVEANSNEQHSIWEYYFDRHKVIKTWEQINPGMLIIIGTFHKRSVCLSLFWAKIDNYIVCFYYGTSELVDWKMIESFLSYQFPNIPKVDATNFNNCLHHLKQLDKNKEKFR